jgi:Pro-kumamolisin, activation domain
MAGVMRTSRRPTAVYPLFEAQNRRTVSCSRFLVVAGLVAASVCAPQLLGPVQASAPVRTSIATASVFEGWKAPPTSTASGNSTLLGAANPATELDVTFGLALQRSDLPELVQSLSTPGASSYRRYRSVAWLARHTGAKVATSTAVLSYLRSQGIVGRLDPTASYVEAPVRVAQASKLFHTSFGRYYV